ncbi:MAG: hypothetical protein CMP22_01535 [Rickettsiales bacterium]|nr:hypothetical protein [Rickettsiales bacterium]
MSRIRQTKTNFTAGEISRRMLGRGDLRAFENGALTLENVFIHPTGGVTRRPGTSLIDEIDDNGRLIGFEFNTEQTYLLVFTDEQIDVYKDDVKVATLSSPYTFAQLSKIVWTQSADTLIICHPDVEPQLLTRSSHTNWALNAVTYKTEEGQTYHPVHRFIDPQVTIDPSGVSGTITLTASTNIFDASWVGKFIDISDGQVEITGYTNATTVSANVLKELSNHDETNIWYEKAFTDEHGWPTTVAFHQDRLVFGGSRDLPNRLWFSKTGDIYNFSLGEGLDDESISFAILSDQVNAITAIFSGRHLQVFTSGAEWMVTGSPLTPSTVQVTRQTRIGSPIDRYIPPINIDGATLFISRNGKEIREFLYTDVEAAYTATDLAILARHIVNAPIDQDYDSKRRLLFVVMEDGSIGVLTVYREEAIAAWTTMSTQGTYKAVATINGDIYFLIERNSKILLEKLDETKTMDVEDELTSETPTNAWLDNMLYADSHIAYIDENGYTGNRHIDSNGFFSTAYSVSSVKFGYPFNNIIEPLPPSVLSPSGNAKASRLVEARFRLEDSEILKLDIGHGLDDYLANDFDEETPQFTGDKAVRAMGWHKDLTKPLWRIEQKEGKAFTLLSVTTETKVND